MTAIFGFGQETYMQHFDVRAGLPSQTVYGCIQARDGWMWFATNRGACRYNGTEMQTFTIANGLVDNEVLRISEDLKGRIWFNTANGIPGFYFHGKFYSPRGALDLREVENTSGYNITEDGEGNVWIIWRNGNRCLLRDGKIEYENFNPKQSGERVSRTMLLQNGDFILKKENGYYNESKKREISFLGDSLDSLNKNCIKSKVQMSPKVVYQYYYDTLNFSIVRVNLFYSDSGDIAGVRQDENDYLWISTWKGLLKFNPKSSKVEQTFLENVAITSSHIDSENNTWITTYEDGVYLMANAPYSSYDFHDNREVAYKVQKIFQDKANIWVALSQKRVARIHGDSIVSTDLGSKKERRAYVTNIVFHQDGAVLVSSDMGIYLLMDDEVIFKTTSKGTYLFSDDKDYIITANQGGAFYKFDYHNYQDIFEPNSEIEKTGEWKKIGKGMAFSDSTVLLMSYDELVEYDFVNDAFISLTEDLNPRMNLLDFARADNELWLCTNGFGVYRIGNGSTQHYNESAGFPTNTCQSVFVFGDTVYFGSSKGLIELEKNNGDMRLFSAPEYFPSNDIKSVLIDQNDNFWISSGDKLVNFPRKKILRKRNNIPLLFDGISVDDMKFEAQESYEIPWYAKRIKLHVSTVNFTNADYITYRYKLFDTDSNWIYSSTPEIQFPSLASNNYCITIQALYNNDPISDQINLELFVQRPFWKKWGFIFGILFLLISIIFIIVRKKIKRIRYEEGLKSKVMEAQNIALRSQMNPHFIFNSLNSIQNFVINNDAINASRFLSKFSSLIRKILVGSDKSSISIEAEVRILEDYLDLERLRLQSRFDYEIKVSNAELSQLFIPSMIIHTFVENAIWHGVSKLEKRGEITVHFEKLDGAVCCVIDDNGIGRAAVLRESHESHGIKNAKDRLKLWDKDNIFKVDFLDKKSEDGNSAGTRVTVILPFKNKINE